MKNRLLGFMLVGCMLASLAGCGFSNETEVASDEETKDVETETNEPEIEDLSEEDKDAVVEVVVNEYDVSQEYKQRFDVNERVGANFIVGSDKEASEFEDWKAAYTALIEDIGQDCQYALIYVDDDDVPELVYKPADEGICVATFTGSTINVFSSNLQEISYIEKENALFASEKIEYEIYDYVLAINEGYWINIATGIKAPLDPWAEDSFDENGEPIISSWKINEEEIASSKAYDEQMKKYYDTGYAAEVKDYADANGIIEIIEGL